MIECRADTPTNTEFLGHAAKSGLRTLSGFDLFRFMALETFRINTDLTPDTEKTLHALAALQPD